MTALSPTRVVNRLLNDLPRNEHERIRERCDMIVMEFGTVLCEPETPISHVYFPLTGFIALVEVVGNHQPLEMGLIGSEGMLGATMALGVFTVPLRAVVQGTGTALRMSAVDFDNELQNTPILLSTLGRYLYILMAQLAQTTACTCFHEVEARLARWLLMTHDRAHANHFHLTHKFLADMLGVQRSAVTIAAGTLQKRMLIHYTRGEINIINRKGLEAASCECYVAVTEDYSSLFPD